MTGLEVDYETHIYRANGARIGGLSEIFAALGIVDRSYFTDYARDRGVAVHTAIEYHLCGGLDWSSVDERIKGYVEGALRFLDDAKVKPGPGTYVERSLWHPLHRFAGTPDLVAECFGDPSVPDWKSGGLTDAAGAISAGYEMLARQAYPLGKPGAVRRRMAVQLHPNGTYTKRDLQDGFDFAYVAHAVSLFNRYHLPRMQRRGAKENGSTTAAA